MAEGGKGLIDTILDRLGINEAPFFRTPDYMYNASYWLGAMLTASFGYTVMTGLFLLLYYIPANAYPSTQAIIHSVPYGSVILLSHLYGAYIMIVLVYIHMFRNFFKGAYKKPRELQWVTGLILFALTLGASFFGYSLVGDVLGVNAVDIGDELLVGTGFPGATTLANWIFGPGGGAAASSNPIIRAELFDRLLGWHIIMVALIGLVFGMHFLMSERYGMTPSAKEKPLVPAYYTKEEQAKFNAWWPRNFVYMLSLVLMTWGVILIVPNLLANINGVSGIIAKFVDSIDPYAHLGPVGVSALPIVISPYPAPQYGSPAAIHTQPYPPWFFLFLYKFVDFELPNGQPLSPAEAVSLLVIGLLVIMFIPFYDNSKYLSALSRKFWTWLMSVFALSVVILSVWGYFDPGIPAPTMQQALYLGVPAFVVAVIIIVADFVGKRKKRTSSNIPAQLPKISPITILWGSVTTLLFAGTLGTTLTQPSIVAVGILVPIGVLMYQFFRKIASYYWIKAHGQAPASYSRVSLNKKIAFYGIIIILIISAFLTGLMWTLPSVGTAATISGLDLGTVLFLWGYAINLYHYVVYVRD
ncbi:cytochrome b [Sulfolobales archaeon HS-7]|nr:cytochrome b [Sulfolobales archaeon HS-7]